MRTIIAAAAIAACLVAPAYANDEPVCKPLDEVVVELAAEGVKQNQIAATSDVDMFRLYNAALGVELPKDIDIVGALFVKVGDIVLVGVIQDADAPCIRYMMRVPIKEHRTALDNLYGV